MFQVVLLEGQNKIYCNRTFDDIAQCFGVIFMYGKAMTCANIYFAGKVLYHIDIFQDGPNIESIITDGVT